MKKLLTVALSLVMLISMMSMSTVFAADGDVILDFSGQALLDANKQKEGSFDNEVGTIKFIVDDPNMTNANGHVVWGIETSQLETEGKYYTFEAKIKITEDDGSTDDYQTVLTLTPKIRVIDEDGNVQTPSDMGTEYTAGDLREAQKDDQGLITLYHLIEPDHYNDDDIITIENRIHFDQSGENFISFDLYQITLYEGDVIPKVEPTETEVPTPTTENTATTAPAKTTAPAAATTATAQSGTNDTENNSNTGLYIIIAVIAVVVIAGVIIITIKKKK